MRFPVHVLKKYQDMPATLTMMLDNYAERSGVPKSNVFQVYILNSTFLGSAITTKGKEIIPVIKDKLMGEPERACAIVIAPNTGPYKQTYDTAACENTRRDLLDELRDASNDMIVKDCSVFFDPKTMWSKSRRCKHEFFFCISNKKDVKGELRSAFAKSLIYVRESLQSWVACHPRHEFVDPTERIAADRGNMSQNKEYAQWITGEGFNGVLCSDIWDGMNVSSQDYAAWFELAAYDHTLASTIVTRAGNQVAHAPKEMVGSIVPNFTNEDGKLVQTFLEKRVYRKVRAACENNTYIIAGAPDLAKAVDVKSTFLKPSYDEKDYVVTKPLADESLPVRQEVVDKWLRPVVPSSLQDTFKTEVTKHNTTHNKGGRPWADTLKRTTAMPADEEATEAKPADDDPKTMDDLTKLHPSLCEKVFDEQKFKLLSAPDGTTYIHALEDTVVLKTLPLAHIAGEFQVGQHYDKAVNDGCELFDWQMGSDDFEASFSAEPALQKPFSADPAPLHRFLYHLESLGHVGTTIECHTYKRVSSTAAAPSDPTRLCKYDVTPSEKCGFRARQQKSDKMSLFGAITPTMVDESKYVRTLAKLKFKKDQMSINPGRPGVFLKKSLRIHKGSFIKLIG